MPFDSIDDPNRFNMITLSTNTIGKIFQTIGVLLLGPLLLDILIPRLFGRSADTVFQTIDTWAKNKSQYLYTISLPSELIKTVRKHFRGRLSKAIEIFLRILVIAGGLLLPFVYIGLMTDDVEPFEIRSVGDFFIRWQWTILPLLLAVFVFAIFRWTRKLGSSTREKRYTSELTILLYTVLTLTGIAFIRILACIFDVCIPSEYYLTISGIIRIASILTLAVIFSSLTIILFLDFLREFTEDDDETDTRTLTMFRSQSTTLIISAVILLLLAGLSYLALVVPEPLAEGNIILKIGTVLAIFLLAIVSVVLSNWLGMDEESSLNALVFIAAFCVAQVIFSIIILVLLLIGLLIQLIAVFPSRYVLKVISVRTTKWLFAFLGGICELLGIWLS